jgi:hypothetical protein
MRSGDNGSGGADSGAGSFGKEPAARRGDGGVCAIIGVSSSHVLSLMVGVRAGAEV